MLSFQSLIPSKPFFSPLNPKPKTLIRPPLRLSNLNPLAKKKQSDLVNENSNQDKLDEKGTTMRDCGVEKSEPPINPLIKPRKKRRGRRSEAQAVEDHVRNQLEQTFSSIREKNPGLLENMHAILKDKSEESTIDEEGEEKEGEQQDEEDPEWPVDADKGWGIRASEYFDKHSIKNVVDNGVEIDWEGEIEEGWVKEINCLEWESFAFHPSPLIVLVFERYNRPSHNWKFLKELESAAKVYWSSKDHLPPRTVKLDVNIETDLAYALKVKETDCPQLLFLRGNHIMYREKEIRSSDELVKMIAHFYYNAKRPDWINSAQNT